MKMIIYKFDFYVAVIKLTALTLLVKNIDSIINLLFNVHFYFGKGSDDPQIFYLGVHVAYLLFLIMLLLFGEKLIRSFINPHKDNSILAESSSDPIEFAILIICGYFMIENIGYFVSYLYLYFNNKIDNKELTTFRETEKFEVLSHLVKLIVSYVVLMNRKKIVEQLSAN